MNQLKPKPGIYIQIKRKKEFPPITKICKLLQKEELFLPGGNSLWWDIIELKINNSSPNPSCLTLSGKIRNDYLLTGCRIARINSIFCFKVVVEYAKSN